MFLNKKGLNVSLIFKTLLFFTVHIFKKLKLKGQIEIERELYGTFFG